MAGASGRHDHITALRTVLRGHRRIRAVTQKPRSRHLLHRVVQDTHANRETFASLKYFLTLFMQIRSIKYKSTSSHKEKYATA
jgi:hypothetical protein